MAASLRSGVAIAQAQKEVSSIVSQTDKEFSDLAPSSPPLVIFYRDYVVGDFKAAFVILAIAGLFVMSIAVVNVTNLFLIQAEKERRAMAVKVALGAGYRRILSEQVIKAFLVSAAGSAIGIVLAWWSIAYMSVLARQRIPRLAEATISLKGMGFTVGVCIVATAVLAIFSVKRPATVSVAAYLNISSTPSTHPQIGIRHFFVILQFGLALMLMIGAGLMIRSLQNLLNIGLGFNPQHVLTFYPKLTSDLYPTNEKRWQYCALLRDRLSRLPGVLAVGTTSALPFGGGLSQVMPVTVEGNRNTNREVRSIRCIVSPGYFEAMRIPVLKGRTFTESDCNPDREQVVIIDQTLARRFWPEDDPIGKSLLVAAIQTYRPREEAPPPTKWLPMTVVGIVPGVTRYGLRTIGNRTPNLPWDETGQYYRPWGTDDGVFRNTAGTSGNRFINVSGFFAVHTEGDPIQLADAVRREIKLTDAAVVPSEFSTMEASWLDFSAERRFYMVILNIFGLAALILAAVGIYGVAAFSVVQRTHEFGVRIALGAKASQIFRLVASEGLRLVGVGGAIGACAGFILSRFLKSMLFEVSEKDLVSFTISIGVLVIAAFLACYLPARRATRLDPWTVLRVG
jgi:predicted permease